MVVVPQTGAAPPKSGRDFLGKHPLFFQEIQGCAALINLPAQSGCRDGTFVKAINAAITRPSVLVTATRRQHHSVLPTYWKRHEVVTCGLARCGDLSNAAHFRPFPTNFLNLISKPCQAIPTQMPSISDPTKPLVPRWQKACYVEGASMLTGWAAIMPADASSPHIGRSSVAVRCGAVRCGAVFYEAVVRGINKNWIVWTATLLVVPDMIEGHLKP